MQLYKKFLILLSMLLNFLTFGEVKKNYDCNFLNDFTFNEENNEYIDLYTGKTNMKIKEGIYNRYGISRLLD